MEEERVVLVLHTCFLLYLRNAPVFGQVLDTEEKLSQHTDHLWGEHLVDFVPGVYRGREAHQTLQVKSSPSSIITHDAFVRVVSNNSFFFVSATLCEPQPAKTSSPSPALTKFLDDSSIQLPERFQSRQFQLGLPLLTRLLTHKANNVHEQTNDL